MPSPDPEPSPARRNGYRSSSGPGMPAIGRGMPETGPFRPSLFTAARRRTAGGRARRRSARSEVVVPTGPATAWTMLPLLSGPIERPVAGTRPGRITCPGGTAEIGQMRPHGRSGPTREFRSGDLRDPADTHGRSGPAREFRPAAHRSPSRSTATPWAAVWNRRRPATTGWSSSTTRRCGSACRKPWWVSCPVAAAPPRTRSRPCHVEDPVDTGRITVPISGRRRRSERSASSGAAVMAASRTRRAVGGVR